MCECTCTCSLGGCAGFRSGLKQLKVFLHLLPVAMRLPSLCPQLCYIYDANARKEARRGRLMRDLILFLGVLATSMAVFTSEISDEENFSRPMGLDTVEKDFYHDYGAVLTCLPILIGILVAVENRFRSVQNYRVLRWASDTIRRCWIRVVSQGLVETLLRRCSSPSCIR